MDLDEIVSRCENYSGADVSALIREASLSAAKELVYAEDHKMEDDVQEQNLIFLKMKNFTEALSRVKSSVSAEDRKYYELMEKRVNK